MTVRPFLFAWLLCIFAFPASVSARSPLDIDGDGLALVQEFISSTDPWSVDTDGDGYTDGEEVAHGYDPLIAGSARLPKRIDIDISEQRLRYSYGQYGEQGNFLVSSGKRGHPTPRGAFTVQRKLPAVRFSGWIDGRYYDYPNTKWNLQFLPKYYIHGAYWHNSFGTPRSKGCVNVAYADMQKLYEFADVGTVVTIHD
jgi:hypothetical protein